MIIYQLQTKSGCRYYETLAGAKRSIQETVEDLKMKILLLLLLNILKKTFFLKQLSSTMAILKIVGLQIFTEYQKFMYVANRKRKITLPISASHSQTTKSHTQRTKFCTTNVNTYKCSFDKCY